MRWGGEVDALPGQNVEFGNCLAETFELRQMWVQIERVDIPKDAQSIQLRLDFDCCRRSVWLRCGLESKAVFNRYAEACKQCAREAAELLPGWTGLVAVVLEFFNLTLQPVLFLEAVYIPDVVMWANEGDMIRLPLEIRSSCSVVMVAVAHIVCSLLLPLAE